MSSGGSLLRLFQSEYFDAQLHMHYLFNMDNVGVHDYLVNELYKMADDDIDFYLPQLVQLALLRFQKSSLHRFLLDKASQSMHFALKIHWLLQSIVEDRLPDLAANALAVVNMVETVVVNSTSSGASKPNSGGASPRSKEPPAASLSVGISRSTSDPNLRSISDPSLGNTEVSDAPLSRCKTTSFATPLSAEPENFPSSPTSVDSTLRHMVALSQASSCEEKAQALGWQPHLPNAFSELGEPEASWLCGSLDEENMEKEMRQFMLKRRRCDFFNTQNHLVSMIMKLSNALVAVPEKAERYSCLRNTLSVINRWLSDRRVFMTFNTMDTLSLLGLHIPILKKRKTKEQILRMHIDQCRIFSSATRAPFLLVYETANLDEVYDTANLDEVSSPHAPAEMLAGCVAVDLGLGDAGSPDGLTTNDNGASLLASLHQELAKLEVGGWSALLGKPPQMPEAQRPRPTPCARCPHADAANDVEDIAGNQKKSETDGEEQHAFPDRCALCPSLKRSEQAIQTRTMIWGEPWQDRVERIRKVSPFRHYKSWGMSAVLVKGGDDLRQELLASQVVMTFSYIFQKANLPLWLKETEVLVTSSSSGLIECIHDAVSIDGMKRHYPGRSLADIFKVAFADQLFQAKRNFIESCAAYSLVVWFLQVKDRHNGNLMMDSSGHVIHIDFGFMLSNSPGGNMAFEQSPFKLTQEFLDVMDGECSDEYEYFRTLVIRGFLEARKHMDRIMLPIRMMLNGSKMPCFREGPDWVLQSLRDRFFTNLTEEACIEKVVDLIDSSVNNWRTIQYDNYQRMVNGIL